jgi:hypothetical protein
VDAVKTPLSKISHVDLVASSIERSLPFYRGLLAPIGWSGLREAPPDVLGVAARPARRHVASLDERSVL